MYFTMVQSPLVGQGFLFIESSRSESDTKIGITLDEWSARHRSLPDNTQQSQKTEIQAPGRIRSYNHSKRATADLCHRKRDPWDCPYGAFCVAKSDTLLWVGHASNNTDAENAAASKKTL